jgi:hypothetical protein
METFSICRHCDRATVFLLADKSPSSHEAVLEMGGWHNVRDALNDYFTIEGHVSIKDEASIAPPEHLPPDIEAAFREGATCLAVGCCNAAGTMFRLCVDLTTRPLLPETDVDGLTPNIRRNLGLRLRWLFSTTRLPESLRDLSACIREDGNDGAHAGTLTKEDAEDLAEFTGLLLERIHTEPERLRLAKDRRATRRSKK